MDALVLAGSVAKGAFGAGVLAGLSDPDAGLALDVGRIVSTSSGALNGAIYAAGVRDGRAREASEELARIWIEEGSFCDTFDLSFNALVARDGFSGNAKLLAMLRRHIKPTTGNCPIDLKVVVANLMGGTGHIGAKPATTFERVLDFDGATFDDAASLERLFVAVTAAAAFPVAFRPVALDIGPGGAAVPCVDGGAVNNAPVAAALADPAVSRVFLIASDPRLLAPPPRALHGFPLLSHFADVLVNERLYRELHEAAERDAVRDRLEALLPSDFEAALDALGWSRRRVPVYELRPREALAGSGFAGFFSRRLREAYVQAGWEVGIDHARALASA